MLQSRGKAAKVNIPGDKIIKMGEVSYWVSKKKGYV
jgi:hypothetical protein